MWNANGWTAQLGEKQRRMAEAARASAAVFVGVSESKAQRGQTPAALALPGYELVARADRPTSRVAENAVQGAGGVLLFAAPGREVANVRERTGIDYELVAADDVASGHRIVLVYRPPEPGRNC